MNGRASPDRFQPHGNREVSVERSKSHEPAPLNESAAFVSRGHAGVWLTWSHFGFDLNGAMIRQQAELAARAGFVQFLIDAVWQRGDLGTQPNRAKFPDFAATAASWG
jgi:hypothetical protein